MKYSLRKSFSYRRRKETPEDDHIYPQIDANGCSNSSLNLVKPVKSKSFLQRQRRSSSPPPPTSQSLILPSSASSDKTKSKVFEPRYDIYSNNDNNDDDDDDDPFSSVKKSRVRPLDRLTNQIRKSFRNKLTRQRSRLESNNSNKRLILNKTNENHIQHAALYPTLSTGLTSPLIIPNENDKIKPSKKQRKAPLAPTRMNQSISFPTEMNPDHHQFNYTSSHDQLSDNNHQNIEQPTFNRSLRTRFSLLLRKRPEIVQQPEDTNLENPNRKSTFGQRFNSLRRSFHIGNRNSSQKGKRHLLSNE